MPIPAQRDVESSRKLLAEWFAGVLSADGQVELSELRGPGATGFSNETLIVDATWTSGGSPTSHTFVVRVAPTGYALFPDAAFDLQHRVLKALGRDGTIPVAGQVRSGQVRSGQVRSGQVRSGQVRQPLPLPRVIRERPAGGVPQGKWKQTTWDDLA